MNFFSIIFEKTAPVENPYSTGAVSFLVWGQAGNNPFLSCQTGLDTD